MTNAVTCIGVVETHPAFSRGKAPENAPEHLQGIPLYLLPPMSLASIWWREAGEEEQEFEMGVSILAPDGRESTLQPYYGFQMTHPFHRFFHETGPIVVRMHGVFSLRVYLRSKGDEGKGVLVLDRPFIVPPFPDDIPEENIAVPDAPNAVASE